MPLFRRNKNPAPMSTDDYLRWYLSRPEASPQEVGALLNDALKKTSLFLMHGARFALSHRDGERPEEWFARWERVRTEFMTDLNDLEAAEDRLQVVRLADKYDPLPLVQVFAEHYLRCFRNYFYSESWQFTAMTKGDRKDLEKANAVKQDAAAKMEDYKRKLVSVLREVYMKDRASFLLLGIEGRALIALDMDDLLKHIA